MIVVFNGTMDNSGNSGCSSCGHRRTGKTSFVTTKRYILPSGVMQVFRAGVAVDVSDDDGQFLLSYRYTDNNGEEHRVFDKVK